MIWPAHPTRPVRLRAGRRAVALALAAALAVTAAACGSGDDDGGAEGTATPDAGGGGGFPVEVEHKFGTTTIDEAPERVVTVGLTDQDAVLALGVTPVGTNAWFEGVEGAIMPWAEDALAANGGETPTVIGNVEGYNFEQIAALRPDLILGVYAGMSDSEYETLSEIAPTVAQPDDYPDWGVPWQDQTRIIGTALGKPDEADALVDDVEAWLAEVTGYDKVSVQPNAGSQGELAGLLAIRGYHAANRSADGGPVRDVCLIPSSAHGTNAASAVMAGMKVVVVKASDDGSVDLDDLRAQCEQHSDDLAAIMVTYPSTHGAYEDTITELCRIVHDHGGQVYVDGANLNAMVGLARPGEFGADIGHLNLHKTFTIPHGGGGPGVGPVGAKAHLAPFLPHHPLSEKAGPASGVGPISGAPFGSAGILPIPYAYLYLMGAEGLRAASKVAILSANYLARRLDPYFPVLYQGSRGRVAHECVVDLRPMTRASGVTAEDVAKRLADYGFHAPTLSFPVPGTLMIEPTESESLEELDRFVEAMLGIHEEAARVESGEWSAEDNPLRNAPHSAEQVTSDHWDHPYSRETAAFPVESLRSDKYWPPVSRVDGPGGDRNLICACPPLDAYS